MRSILIGLTAAAALLPAAAFAGTPAASTQDAAVNAVQQSKARTVYVCENNAMTRRAFAREFGKVEFVSAAEAKAGGAAWDTPKCITASEARRLKLASVR